MGGNDRIPGGTRTEYMDGGDGDDLLDASNQRVVRGGTGNDLKLS